VTEPDVFVVRSPFQLVNAREAIAAYGSTDPRICILRSAPNEMVQIDGIVERAGFDHVTTVDRIDELPAQLEPRAGRVFLGDYREPEQRWLARRLGASRPIVLDDGNATLMVARRRSRPWWRLTDRRVMSLSARSHQRSFPIPTLVRDVRRPGARECSAIEFFSIYRVRGARRDRLRPNDLSWLRSQIEPATSERPVFIGSSLVETGIMRTEAYRTRVGDVARVAEGPLLYIAHRKETEENLDVLRREHDIEVLRPDVPIELVLSEQRIRPTKLWAVLSSAYDTLRMIFPDAAASCAPPVPDEVEPAFRAPMAAMVELTRATRLVATSNPAPPDRPR
jgi:hypothetical protein